jgi:hypothetical protein
MGIRMFIVLFLPMASGRVKNKRPEANPKKYIEQKRSMLDYGIQAIPSCVYQLLR